MANTNGIKLAPCPMEVRLALIIAELAEALDWHRDFIEGLAYGYEEGDEHYDQVTELILRAKEELQ